MANCSPLQKSLNWCMGAPELPGIRRRIYYISKNEIAMWPRYNRDANRRTKTSVFIGSFTLVADAKWKYIDILADKSQLTSDPQGEIPSQTQLNKLTAIHPGVGPEATAAACYLNNSDNVFIVEDMKGLFRVVGSEKWITKTTVTQDNGQGPTGTTSTTINVEATDEVPAPFYVGTIETEDGNIDCSESYEGSDIVDTGGNSSGNAGSNTGGGSGSGNSGNGSSGSNSGGSSDTPTYDNIVVLNGDNRPLSSVGNGTVYIVGPLTSVKVTGQNIEAVQMEWGAQGATDVLTVASDKKSATWSGNISATPIHFSKGAGRTPWFTLVLRDASEGDE